VVVTRDVVNIFNGEKNRIGKCHDRTGPSGPQLIERSATSGGVFHRQQVLL
jgi:hypothetical protein